MSKYDSATVLIKRRARSDYFCDSCRKTSINAGDFYYSLELDRIHSPYFKRKKFCQNCYKQNGNNLLNQ